MTKSASDACHPQDLERQRAFTEQLLHSAIPPARARRLRWRVPEEWHKMSLDEFPDCTVVQMDIQARSLTDLTRLLRTALLCEAPH